MNQNLYRIIFNKARGCLMAVAETTASQGKPGERGGHRPSCAALRISICAALAGACLSMAQAQIVSDPGAPANQRPTVLTTGGGNIPLANIQTPSAAGVSRNTYSQFDVNRAGAVLNNSRTNVQTQIGGWVQGNPWLASGPARVILNEVNASKPSYLRGPIEVAGARAEVLIANPSGIQVDGAGFINTSRATLTTGTPIMSNGHLDGYRVERGTVNITGAGLDASGTDSTAILARAVEINAGLWANHLTVTTGANTVSADTASTTPIAGAGPAPIFALDVAAIGGMYAGKITLVGTEAGLGVRNAGVIQANAGDLVLNANGWLSNTGSLSASQNLLAQTSGAVSNAGAIYAGGSTALTAAGDIGNAGLVAALGNTAVTSGGAITGAGGSVLAAGLAADNSIAASGSLSVTAAGNTTLAGQSLAGMEVRIAASSVNVASGQISGQNLSLAAKGGDVNAAGATLVASQTLTASTPQSLRTDGAVLSATQLNLGAHDVFNVGGQLVHNGTGDLALNLAGGLDNRGGSIATNGRATLIAGAIDNTRGRITTGGELSLQATTVTNTGTLYAGGNQTLVATGMVQNSGVIGALGDTTVTAQSLSSTSTSLLAAGLKADGSLAGAGDLRVITTQGLVANGQSFAGGNASLRGAWVDLSGSQTRAANLTIDASQGNVSTAGATLTTAGNLTVHASANHGQTLDNTRGTLSAGQLDLRVANLDNTRGQIYQTGSGDTSVVLTSPTGLLNNTNGTIAVNSQNLSLSASTLVNNHGSIEHAGSGMLAITADTLDDQYGQVIANGGLSIAAGGIRNGNATMLARQIALSAASLDNRGGTVQAAGTANLTLTSTSGLDNSAQGFIGAGGNLALAAVTLDNTQGQITAGGTWTATASGAVTNNGGLLAAMGEVTLQAGSLDNRSGSIASVESALSVTTTGTTTNDGGSIQAALDVRLNNSGLSNAGTDSRITGSNLAIDTHGQSLVNTAGTLAATNNLSLHSGALNNSAGLIQTTGGTGTLGIDTQGQTLTNTSAAAYASGATGAGGISARGAMALATGTLNNAAGYLGSGGTMTASTGQVNNTAGGQIVGQSGIGFTSTGFDNSAGPSGSVSGQVQALGDVSLNVGAGRIDNTAGLLRSAGTLSLTGHAVINNNTLGASQGTEGYNVAIAASIIANNSGAIRADHDTTLSSSGSIDNSQGVVSAGNNLTVQDLGVTPNLAVTNTGGRQIAMRSLSFNAAGLTGDGKMQSQGNLSITLASDYRNTDEVTANGSARINTSGNITNSGTLQAGDILSLNASNIDNTATGKISATTTRLTASNTVSNRGLIDGVDTQINASLLNNIGTGRIYGDHVSIAVGTVNNLAENGSAATIAARNRLDMGAGVLNNSGGAQIFSLGDMAIGGGLDGNRLAIGAAGTITNSASPIQALGNLAINTATLNNLNPGFAYTLTNGGNSSAIDYIAADGSVYRPIDFGWESGGVPYKYLYYQPPGAPSFAGVYIPNDLQNGGQLRSSPYADPLYKQFYEGPNAHTPAFRVLRLGGSAGDSFNYTDVPETFAYDRSSPVWQVFGVTAPIVDTPGRYPTGTHNAQQDIEPTADEIAAWQAKAAPWIELQAKLDAFRAVVKSYMVTVQTYRDYTETSHSAEVTASTPGQILSGGNLAIHAGSSALNDNSKIMAGGALSVTGAAVNNRATQVTSTNTRNGTVHTWGVVGEDCGGLGWGCDPIYGWLNNPYTQDVASTVTLGIGVTQSNTSSVSSRAIGIRSPAATAQGAQGAGGVQVNLAALANTAIGTQLGPMVQTTHADASLSRALPAAALQGPTSVARFTQITTGAGAKVQSVQPNAVLPTASLFRATPAVTVGYLVETDPAFTNYRQWLSSDALLTALSYDPATVQKRLGDGFYEQQLIREQVAELTGHRFLTGYASDEAQYQALIDSGVTYAKAWNLVPGIALSAAQMAQLTTDMVWLVTQTVTLADGSTRQVLVPQLYAVVRDGDLSDSGALLAGGTVNVNLAGDLTNTGTIMGRSVVAVTADSIQNLGGRINGTDVAVQAATDLTNIGGQISASNSLLATAGRDLHLTSTTLSTQTQTASYTGVDRVASLYVTAPGGTLVAAAGRDMNLLGAAIGSAGTATLQAGRNLNLQALNQTESVDATRDASNYTRFAQSQGLGSTVQAVGAVTLSAGQDLTTVAANINSTAGATVLAAAGDVHILAGRSTSSLATASYAEGSGFMSSGSTRLRNSQTADNAQASNVGGQTVAIIAGRDLHVTGANVVSDAGTTLMAQRDIAITSDTNRSTGSSFFEQKGSGLSIDGGISYGKQQQSTDSRGSGDTAAGSTVAALTGDVTVVAGQQYRQVGSSVQTPSGNIVIQAQDVAITEARERSESSTVTKQSSSGFTLAGTSPLLSAAQTGMQMVEAAGQTKDARMQALAAANVGLAGYNAVQDIAKNGGKPGVDVSLSFGSSSSTSTTTNQSNSAAGSTVAAGGNVSIVATGGGKDSNILVQGSSISAGDTTTLKADNDILLHAAQSTSSEHSSSQGKSSSLGVSVGTGGLNVTASASRSKGQGDGADLTYTNTTVSGGKAANLQSGGDTTLAGATIAANTITADIGGNLLIQSLQDQSSYHSRSSSGGGSLTIGTAPGASVSVSKTKVDSDFQSVGTQSGLLAGDEGFQVAVKGDTTLTGGVISSTQAAVDSGVNRFATGGTLTLTDVQNVASYSASGYSVSGRISTSTDDKGNSKTTPAASPGYGQTQGAAASTTSAGISGMAGNTTVRTGDAKAGLQKIFDADKVRKDIEAQVLITQTFGQEAGKLVKDYSQGQRKTLQEQLNTASTEIEKQAIQAQINDVNMQERVMNVLVGAVTGFGAGALTKESLSAAADQMRQLMIEDSKKFAGVVDSTGQVISNLSGPSEGLRGDGTKVGGTRIDLDLLCGAANDRCKTITDANGKKTLDLKDGMVQFDDKAVGMTLSDFIKTPDGQNMLGPTGGLQGVQGTLFGKTYEAGSWQDKLIESFSGTHDMIGGKASGLYDEQGNIKRGMTRAERGTYNNLVTTTAIIPSMPFAAAELLSPEVWNAISIFLKGAK